jgi:hypothetical protein
VYGGKEATAIQNSFYQKINIQVNRRCFLPLVIPKTRCHPEILPQKKNYLTEILSVEE